MRNYRIHSIAALTVTIAFTVAACAPDSESTGPATDGASAAVHTTDPGDMLVNDGDGLSHLAVQTINAATTPETVESVATLVTVDDGAGGPARVTHDLEVVVHRLDGATETVTIPNESLVAVGPETGEQSALDAAGTGAVIVIDVSGAIGPAGRRYVLVGDTLIELAEGPVTAPTDAVTPAPVTASTPATSAVPESSEMPVYVAATDSQIADAIAAIEGVVTVTADGPGHLLVAAATDAATISAAIEAVAGVTDVSEVLPVYPTGDTRQGEQWSLANTGSGAQAGGWTGVAGADIGAPAAWTVTKGAGVVVAVIDSGVQLTHPDLASRVWTNTRETSCFNGVDDDGNGFKDDCDGWDFGAGNTSVANSGDNNPNPDAPNAYLSKSTADHGTHVAGIIAAAANGIGTVGVSPDATIMPLKVFGPNSNASNFSYIAFAIDYAVANGADVINMSVGSAPRPVSDNTRSLITQVEAAVNRATAAGVVVVAAAGNNGVDITNVDVWPASLSVFIPGMITVGASRNNDERASFSNVGTPVNLVAPGWWDLSTIPGSGWAFMSGTSMAAPTVAGAAALVISSGVATTPAAVRTRLVATTDQTAAGRRLNAAIAVGTDRLAGVPPTLSVGYTGVGSLTPNTIGNIGIKVQAATDTGISQIRLSVATREVGAVAAVEGLHANFSDADGAIGGGATSEIGAFPAVPLRDAAALNGSGMTVTAGDINLPAGEYAFVTELLDESGTAVGGAQVAYVTVADQPVSNPGPGTTTATTVATNPIPTPPTPTTAPAGGGPGTTTPPPATTTPTGGGGAGTTTPASTIPTGGGGTATTAPTPPTPPATTAPIATAPASTTATTAPARSDGAVPATTAPAGAVPPTTTAGGTAPATTAAATVPTSTAPVTTAPSTTVTTTPATTTPAPPPAGDGVYRATALSPRLAPLCGGTSHTIDGTFPTNVPIYVWFGADPNSAVEAHVTASRLTVTAPLVISGRVVDVVVRFTTSRAYALTLAAAFTFSGTCTPPPNGGGGTGTSMPGATVPPTTGPRTAPPTTQSPTTQPATTQPATTQPATTAPAVGNVIGNRGSLTLRRLPATGAIAALSATGWPTAGCRQPSCGAARL